MLDRFDGGVASCEVHINKPDPRIYQALLDQYGLKASECVFIDDNLANVQAAFTLGFVGIRMKDGVPEPICPIGQLADREAVLRTI